MKKKNFEDISGALNRDEMKKIMAGSGTSCSTKCTPRNATGPIGCYPSNGTTGPCRCLDADKSCS